MLKDEPQAIDPEMEKLRVAVYDKTGYYPDLEKTEKELIAIIEKADKEFAPYKEMLEDWEKEWKSKC